MTDGTREREDRGRAIEERARRHGLYSAYDLEAMTIEVGRKVPRKSIGKAYKGLAGDTIYQRLEDALALFEERTDSQADAAEPVDEDEPRTMEVRVRDATGAELVIVAPVSDAPELEGMVMRLIREMRDRSE